jgi:predicted nucleotidyltransferase
VGAFVHPIEHYLGFGRRDTFERWVGEYDIVEYELRKLVNLLLRSNPNILPVLWLPRERVLVSSPAYEALIANRDISASKAVYAPFAATPRAATEE